jgi:site-specific DNA-methyltransferase (adenine-specific)
VIKDSFYLEEQMIELNKIYNEDCLEGMKRIPDKSIDMILCDLPYGTTQNKWDSVIPLDLLWEQYEKIIKDNGAIILFSQTPFDKILGCSNLKLLKYEWIWEKTKPTGHLNAKKMPLKQHENILVFYKSLPTYNCLSLISVDKMVSRTNKGNYGKSSKTTKQEFSGYPRSILRYSSIITKEQLHQTQKPIDLCEYLIKTYTNECETVLDNCIGSGTTAIACINTNRNYIGFELDKTYFDIANERIEKHKLNQTQ